MEHRVGGPREQAIVYSTLLKLDRVFRLEGWEACARECAITLAEWEQISSWMSRSKSIGLVAEGLQKNIQVFLMKDPARQTVFDSTYEGHKRYLDLIPQQLEGVSPSFLRLLKYQDPTE